MGTEPLIQVPEPDDLAPARVLARVETDRFCDGCGYNLHSQAVYEDAGTRLLVCRCPECGRIHAVRDDVTAGRVWLRRVGTVLLFAWMLLVILGGLAVGGLHIGLMAVTLEELSAYRAFPSPAVNIRASSAGNPQILATLPSTVWRRDVRELNWRDALFLGILGGVFAALGFLLAALLAVALYHWPRWCYLIPVVLVPLTTGMLTWLSWRLKWPHLGAWAWPYLLEEGCASLLGGLLGVLIGRASVRLVATVLLPPRARQALAFLWRVDGRRLPGVPAGAV